MPDNGPDPRFDPAIAAVVVVDVQNDFCHPDGVCAQAGNDPSAAIAMVPRLGRLLTSARQAGTPVVWIQTTHDASTDSPVWLARRGGWPGEGGAPAVRTCQSGSWGAEFYLLAPEPGEAVVVKHRYSAFAGTDLDVVLRTAGRTSLLLTGVATDVCVESTLRDGLFADYHVTLVEDCCASYHQESHDATVRTVENYFGRVASSAEIAAQWSPQLLPR